MSGQGQGAAQQEDLGPDLYRVMEFLQQLGVYHRDDQERLIGILTNESTERPRQHTLNDAQLDLFS